MSTNPAILLSRASPELIARLTDVHVHPTDNMHTAVDAEMRNLGIRICAMSTHSGDQHLVRELAEKWPQKVTPCFGHHPWWSHQIALNDIITSKEDHYRSLFGPSASDEADFMHLVEVLPDPVTLTSVLSTLRCDMQSNSTAMLGEVGLDRIFRVPYSYTAEPRILSPFTVPIEHQISVLEAQIGVAVDMRRNISMHSVKAQKYTVDLLSKMKSQYREKWVRISVDMHSCGLSSESWLTLERAHPNVYLSLSTVINSRSENHKKLIAACSPTRLLVESDYNDIRKSVEMTWQMVCTIATVRGWAIEDNDEAWNDNEMQTNGEAKQDWGVVRRLAANFSRFEAANHVI